ncbi:hypothetical protein HHK36_025985 [Tetracentron sinense]|uniref:Uncharacterized protein n=1 Tax=Tetracentron sinense TaxID=13715 RepID=A0A834YPA8_TETSI|nr:hypothetical protein HHK36_025979 [Tetracentron sinense]KAF8389292.1 hypothetical protein HHK36_025985 [Tetracentron sinense]
MESGTNGEEPTLIKGHAEYQGIAIFDTKHFMKVLEIDGDTRFAERDEISTRDSDLPTPSHVVGIPAIGCGPSLCSQAAHIISDLTTILLNPISDEPSKPHEDMMVLKISQQESVIDGDLEVPSDVPNTSSFTIFLYSLLSSS